MSGNPSIEQYSVIHTASSQAFRGLLWKVTENGAGEHHGLGVFPEMELSVRLEIRQSRGAEDTFWRTRTA